MHYPHHIWNAYCFVRAYCNWLIELSICSSRSVISLHKCHYVYIFLPPFQENSTTCPATTAPPATPSSGLSIAEAIAIGVTLGLLGVAVAVAIIVVVVVVMMHKRRGVGKRSSWVNIQWPLCTRCESFHSAINYGVLICFLTVVGEDVLASHWRHTSQLLMLIWLRIL